MCIACIHPAHISQNIPWFSGCATELSVRVERGCGLFGLFHLLFSTSTSSPVYKCSLFNWRPVIVKCGFLFLTALFFKKKHLPDVEKNTSPQAGCFGQSPLC